MQGKRKKKAARAVTRDRVFVGVDWSKDHHDISVIDRQREVLWEAAVESTCGSIDKLCEELRTFVEGHAERVEIGIERPDGLLVRKLLAQGFVVKSANPKLVVNYRKSRQVSPAKSDAADARMLAEALLSEHHMFRVVSTPTDGQIELRHATRESCEVATNLTRATNRLREQLLQSRPALERICPPGIDNWMLEVIALAPSYAAAQRVKLKDIATIVKRYRVRSMTAEKILAACQERDSSLTPAEDRAIGAALERGVELVRLLRKQRKELRGTINAVLDRDDVGGSSEAERAQWRKDRAHLATIPMLGPILLATLVAEGLPQLIARDGAALRMLCGAAPVTIQSGRTKQVIMRRACNPQLREAIFWWAMGSIRRDATSQALYKRLRSRGTKHAGALRAVGDKLLSMMMSMLRRGTDYDPDRRGVVGAAESDDEPVVDGEIETNASSLEAVASAAEDAGTTAESTSRSHEGQATKTASVSKPFASRRRIRATTPTKQSGHRDAANVGDARDARTRGGTDRASPVSNESESRKFLQQDVPGSIRTRHLDQPDLASKQSVARPSPTA